MSVSLPVPWIGGDLADELPEDPKLLRKTIAEKLSEIQQNFEALSRKALSGPQDLGDVPRWSKHFKSARHPGAEVHCSNAAELEAMGATITITAGDTIEVWEFKSVTLARSESATNDASQRVNIRDDLGVEVAVGWARLRPFTGNQYQSVPTLGGGIVAAGATRTFTLYAQTNGAVGTHAFAGGAAANAMIAKRFA